ncbi:MAG: DUF5694 domain-containing protein [Longimicrobiales bacterium]
MNKTALAAGMVAVQIMSVGLPLGAQTGSEAGASRAGLAIDTVLAPQVTPAFASQVLVLGTPHLSGFRDRLGPHHLAPLLDRLASFAPTKIAVESLTPDEVALLVERAPSDSAAAQVLDMFAGRTAALGASAQRLLEVDRLEAARRAEAILEDRPSAMAPPARVELVVLLLAAYEYDSATLQWSYLGTGDRASAERIPTEIQEALDAWLASANEIVTVALPLARRLGLQRLHPMDSQLDGVRTLSHPPDALRDLFADPARGALMDHDARARGDSIADAALAAGDLLPLYGHMNSFEYQRGDAAQWKWLFQEGTAGRLHRFRYAMWEARNLRQAMHILDVAASADPQRVLVIVGASHKAPVERILATQLTVRLVDAQRSLAPAD